MARARTSRSAPAPRSRWRRRIVVTLQILIGLGILAFGALVIAVYVARSQLPSFDELKSSPNGQMIRVHAADGSIIASLGPSYGEWLPYAQIPRIMRQATVAVEDRRFRGHPGVDPIGIARSVQVRFERGRWVQGGSTITQQLARNVFLNNQKKFGRKLREWILALALGEKFDTTGVDVNSKKVAAYRAGQDPAGEMSGERFAAARRLSFADDVSAVAGCDVVIVAVPTPIDASKQPDLEPLKGASATIGAHLKKGDMATEAERLLADTGWLPEPLRLVDPDAVTSGDVEADDLPEFLAGDSEDEGPADEEGEAQHMVAAE